jgi:hypothetical protein
MYIYAADGDRAFNMLKSRARNNRIKLRLLAQRLLDNLGVAEDLWH